MTTFAQHHASLSRVQPDAPHPDSYRPDLPLRSELQESEEYKRAYDEGYDAGHSEGKTESNESKYDEGYEDGKAEGRRLEAARVRELETENATLREKLKKIA